MAHTELSAEEKVRLLYSRANLACNPRLGYHAALSGVRMFVDPGHCPLYDCIACGAVVIGDPRGVVHAI